MTKEEKRVLFDQAWKEVLGVDEVKDEDSFFDVGGDSIKGVQLVGWLVQKGLKLDMLKIYTAPTVAEMVEALEETQPMAVPSQLLTKDNFQQFMNDPVVQQGMMNGMGLTGGPVQQIPGSQPAMPQGQPMGQQLCTPEQMPQGQPMGQQLCTPAPAPQGQPMGQQLCTPEQMPQGQPMGQQLCTPEQMPQGQPMGQQLFTPAPGQQLCTPAPVQQLCAPAPVQQLCTPAPVQQLCAPAPVQQLSAPAPVQQLYAPAPGQQLCAPAPVQQLYAPAPVQQLSAPAPGQQLCAPAPVQQLSAPAPGQQLCTPAPAPQGQPMGQQAYMGFPVNAPIDNPNTIGINAPKLGQVTKSPEDALDTVLAGILANGYDKKANLLDQGLSSFGLMQLITRCAELGYRVKMEDVIKDPTFTGIVNAMKTE